MSRIGRLPITIPAEIKVELKANQLTVIGPKGSLTQLIPAQINLTIKEKQLLVGRRSEEKKVKALHGLVRSLIANMVTGVTQGYRRNLKLVGTGYRAKMEGDQLVVNCGYSYPVKFKAVSGIIFEVPDNETIIVNGINKQLVGQVAAGVRQIRPPEPYKGKGIRYQDEVVRRKTAKVTKLGATGTGGVK